jgi:hypothetical protein
MTIEAKRVRRITMTKPPNRPVTPSLFAPDDAAAQKLVGIRHACVSERVGRVLVNGLFKKLDALLEALFGPLVRVEPVLPPGRPPGRINATARAQRHMAETPFEWAIIG